MLKTLCIIFFIFCIKSLAQFGPQRVITMEADGSQIIFAVDLDGDNKMDILSANKFGSSLTWYRNIDGQGNFGTQNIIADFQRPTAIYAADLDGDGDLDVIATSSYQNRVVWYQNRDGKGDFGPPRIISATSQGAFSAIAADIDGDGDLDIIIASDLDATVAWYENLDGLGNFGPKQVISANNANCRVVVAADIDGDGDLDIVVNGSNGITLSWFENLDGQGNFGPKRIISSTAIYPNGMVCVDLDGDMDLDIVIVSPASDSISWFENLDGMGTFGPEILISNNLSNAWSVYSADLDNDGDLDILATSADAFGGEVVWFENLDGSGNFSEKKTINKEVQSPRSVIAADLDNDGDMDVIASSQNDDKIAWYENLTILGMDKKQVSSFLIYPNPVKDILNLESHGVLDIKSTTLYDTYGRTFFKIDKGVSQIDFSNYATGIYFLKLLTSKGEKVFKVVRE